MNVDRFVMSSDTLEAADAKWTAALAATKANLDDAIAHYRRLASQAAYDGENLASLAEAVEREAARIEAAWLSVQQRLKLRALEPSAHPHAS
jgi:hypothetical protein